MSFDPLVILDASPSTPSAPRGLVYTDAYWNGTDANIWAGIVLAVIAVLAVVLIIKMRKDK